METEILYCLVGIIAGYLLLQKRGPQGKANHSSIQHKACKLDKLLHNIESYDGTEKNQLQIGGEEE